MRIRKAILPVAGIGTRFLPATKMVPKELLPIVDKPVIQYLVEEAVASGIEEIIFVISPGKEAILDHFRPHEGLEGFLRSRGKLELLERIQAIHRMAKFSHAYQNVPIGCGDAILQAKDLVGNEPFLVLFGDDIVKHPVPAAKQMIERFSGEALIAVEQVAGPEISLYGVITPQSQEGRTYKVGGMVEKPPFHEAPSDLGIIGKYLFPPEIFQAIEQAGFSPSGERRTIDGIAELAKTQSVWAYRIEGQRFDTGKPSGLLAAGQAYLAG